MKNLWFVISIVNDVEWICSEFDGSKILVA